jgi:hypothetical protein
VTRRDDVIEQIREAFKGVILGNGIGLLEGNAIDDYAGEITRKTCREQDERLNWEAIPVKALNECYWCLHYLDAEGMRFLLPAFLIANIKREILIDPLFVLTEVADYEKFALFSSVQREAVRNYLLYARDDPNHQGDRPNMDLSIEAFWKA